MEEASTAKIAIVGAGAMGVMTGFHLGAAGAEVTYLVRPTRTATLPKQFHLYSYNDGSTKVFNGFRVVTDPSELAEAAYDFVVVTMDGSSLTSKEGHQLLAAIGAAVRDHDTVVIIGSVGIGLREFAVEASGLAEDRVINGMFALLCHKTVGVSLPLHSPTNARDVAAADFAFRYLSDAGFVLEQRNGEAAARFSTIFDRSGLVRCFVLSGAEFALQSRAIFPVFAAGDILGWPAADDFTADPLWLVAVEAVRSIQGLAEHGEAGRAAAQELTAEGLSGMWRQMENAALPLDWQAFNAYQHGSKVRLADIQLLEGCIARGQSEGRNMSAVRKLVDLFDNRDV